MYVQLLWCLTFRYTIDPKEREVRDVLTRLQLIDERASASFHKLSVKLSSCIETRAYVHLSIHRDDTIWCVLRWLRVTGAGIVYISGYLQVFAILGWPQESSYSTANHGWQRGKSLGHASTNASFQWWLQPHAW